MLPIHLVLAASALAGAEFDRYDANKDGHIEPAEISEPMGGIDAARNLMSIFDVDRDGNWTQAETDAWAKTMHEGPLAVPVEAFAQAPTLHEAFLGFFRADDANNDGVHSGNEGRYRPGMLPRLDADGSGTLSPAEVWPLHMATLDTAAPSVRRMFENLVDEGKDGRLGKGEIERGIRLLAKDLGTTAAVALTFDESGDGHIEGNEVNRWLEDAFSRAFFRYLDESKDGKISVSEARGRTPFDAREVAALMDGFDKDKSGSLSESEFLRWRAFTRAQSVIGQP